MTLQDINTITHLQKIEPVDTYSHLNFYKITYLSDGLHVKGFVIEPKEGQNLPVLIYNRGGSKDFGKIDDRKMYGLLAPFADKGFVVFASQYRGNDGSEGKDEYCGSDIDDIINLKSIIDAYIPKVNPEKIFMYGASRGGLMTYKALTMIDWVKAAVIKAGSANEMRGYQERPDLKEFRSDMYDTNDYLANAERSPLLWSDEQIAKIKTPILLLHGTGDCDVNCLDSLEMSIRLKVNSVPFSIIIFDGDDHRLSQNRNEAGQATLAFYNKFLSQ